MAIVIKLPRAGHEDVSLMTFLKTFYYLNLSARINQSVMGMTHLGKEVHVKDKNGALSERVMRGEGWLYTS